MKRIFLVGAPRSGTTMLQSLLASHPAIISVPESRFFQYLLDDKYSNALVERLEVFFVDEIRRPEFLNYFSSEQSTLEKAQAFVKVLDTLAVEKNLSIWLEKTPEHLYFIDYIEELLPEALFIHILRDPVDVIASMYEASRKAPDIWGGAWSIDWCISRWKDSALISYKNVNKTNHILVKYEQVVEDPKDFLSKLCKFIGINFDESMLNNYKENAKRLSLKATWHEGIERDIKSSKIHKYHSIFKRAEIEYILKEIKPTSAGAIEEIGVEVSEPILDIYPSVGTDRIKCLVKIEGEEIGNLELPVCDGLVAGSVLADAIATKFAWEILGRFFENT
ncbi:MAG TPA: sulfotransferase, partial [Kamptonema sp.]|nr:sulfotransferase [Kamptonema sp.]